MNKIPVTLMAALLLLLSCASVSYAQSSVGGYNDTGGDVQDQVVSPGGDDGGTAGDTASSPTPAAVSETLPFTGLDLLLIGAAGAVFVGLGLLMRRMTRPASDTA